MLGSKLRIFLAAVVVFGIISFIGSDKAEAGWGYTYRPYVPVYRPAYRVGYRAFVPAPVRYVAPLPRAVYRPVVPVAPVFAPYYPGYSGFYPGYTTGYRGVGVSVGFGVAPVGFIGY